MTPKERVFRRLRGESVDRLPNLSIIMQFATNYCGHKYGDFCGDYKVLVDAMLRTTREFGMDAVTTLSDPFREAADFGAAVVLREDDLPVMKERFMRGVEDFTKLRRFDVKKSTRMLDRVKAVAEFKRVCGEEYPIIGWIEGAWAEMCDLTVMSDSMMLLLEEPEEAEPVLELLAEQAIDCALAQVEAGADIIGLGDAACSLISASLYREYMLPLEQKIISAVHDAGAMIKLHICGNISHLLPDIMETGADIVDLDYMVDFGTAVELAGNRTSICGNICPAGIILQGSVEDVCRETLDCARKSGVRGIVSTGCEIPKYSPHENVRAITETLWDYAKNG